MQFQKMPKPAGWQEEQAVEIRRDWISYLAGGMGIDAEGVPGAELETLVVRRMLEQAVRARVRFLGAAERSRIYVEACLWWGCLFFLGSLLGGGLTEGCVRGLPCCCSTRLDASGVFTQEPRSAPLYRRSLCVSCRRGVIVPVKVGSLATPARFHPSFPAFALARVSAFLCFVVYRH